MKVLSLGDLHIKTSNLRDIDIFFKELENYLGSNQVDLIVNHGDTLDTHGRLHSLCLSKAIEYANLLEKFAPTVWIVGNHDMVDETRGSDSPHWLSCLKSRKRTYVVDKVTLLDKQSWEYATWPYRLICSPYIPEGKFVAELDKSKLPWKEADAIFSHVTIRGAKMGSIVAEGDKWDAKWPLLITGHIHQKQVLADNMIYTGSIMQVSNDEKRDKSCLLLAIDKDKKTISEVKFTLPGRRIIELTIEEARKWKSPKEPLTTYVLYISSDSPGFHAFEKTTAYQTLCLLPEVGKKNIKFRPVYKEAEIVFHQRKSFLSLMKDMLDVENNKESNGTKMQELWQKITSNISNLNRLGESKE